MPYSVSMPMTLVMAIRPPIPEWSPGSYGLATRPSFQDGPAGSALEVLSGVDLLDGAAEVLGGTSDEGAHVDDALALLARDPRPVVRVGGVGQVLVLLELVGHRVEQVGRLDALLVGLQEALDRHLLGPGDDVLDHRAGVEVLEVQDLLVAVGVGDLQEAVLLGLRVHAVDRLEDQLLHLGLWQVLEDEAGAAVEQQRVAGAQLGVAQRLADLDHALLVGVADHQGAVDAEHLLELDDLALHLVGARLDHVEGLVEHHLLAGLQRLRVDLGVHVDAQLAPAGGDVDGAVLVDREEDAVAAWRRGELLDLLLEGDDLLTGLAQGGCQALVLGQRLGELALGLQQALLQHADLPRGVVQATAEQGRLLLQELDLAPQLARLDGRVVARVGLPARSWLLRAVGVLHLASPLGGGGNVSARVGRGPVYEANAVSTVSVIPPSFL